MDHRSPEIQVSRPPVEAKKKSKSLPSFGRSGPAFDYTGIFKSFEQEDAKQKDRRHVSTRRRSSHSSSSISDTSCSSVEFLTPQKWFSQESRLGFLPNKRRQVHASTESLSRRERLEAVKARVAAERKAKCRDSSSEEEAMEEQSRLKISRHHSDEALGRSRSARTERYLKRRSQDEHSLRQNSSPIDFTQDVNVIPCENSRRVRQEFTWRDSDAYEIPSSPLENNIVFQLNQSSESAKENRPHITMRKNDRSNSLCVFPTQTPFREGPKTHPFRSHQCKPLTVSTSYGINFMHPSPCDSGLSSQSVASSPSIGRAPTPPPRLPQSKAMVNETAKHLQVKSSQRPVSCSLETVFDSGRYSKSPTLTLQSETCSSGRSSPWVQRMVANFEKRQLESSSPVKFVNRTSSPSTKPGQQSSNIYSYTDVPPTTVVPPSGSVVYSYTDQAPRVLKKQSDAPLSAYMSDSQLMARNRSSIAVDKPTSHNWKFSRLFDAPGKFVADPVASHVEGNWRRSQTPPPVSSRSSLMGMTNQKNSFVSDFQSEATPPAPPIRRESSSYSTQRHRRSSENFEDALQELEEIYNSLRLNSDEDLLDRAERRDLPCAHQLMRTRNFNSHVSEPEPDVHKFVNGYSLTRSNSDGVGRPFTTAYGNCHRPQQRTPPNRRSAIPDKVADDMANRRLQKPEKSSPEDNTPISYMLCSPVYTPSLTVDEFFKDYHNKNQPDIEYDDLNYRKFVQSDGARVQAPHPPFGIPLNPLTKSSNSDYLKTKVTNVSSRPSYRPSKTSLADPVRDDLAYRNLRKDYPMVNGHDPSLKPSVSKNSHRRAVRSLSVNFSDVFNPLSADNQEFERAQSMSDLIAALEKESEKWERLSNEDISSQTVQSARNDMGSSTETLTESLSKRDGALKPTSVRSPTPPIPTRRSLALPLRNNSYHHDFWSDSDIRQQGSNQVTPIDDKELDDLLNSLTRDSSVTDDPVDPTVISGEVHGVLAYRLRPNSPPFVY